MNGSATSSLRPSMPYRTPPPGGRREIGDRAGDDLLGHGAAQHLPQALAGRRAAQQAAAEIERESSQHQNHRGQHRIARDARGIR
ncbi:hypothetical protein ACP6EP_15350 [Achromobacter xylosoxidans]|uniref:hypothetical protein n=1 Tax=Alcaligenes xylosoxydans xylosoxydans TaxID=85698 RepID=UPI003CEB8310